MLDLIQDAVLVKIRPSPSQWEHHEDTTLRGWYRNRRVMLWDQSLTCPCSFEVVVLLGS